MVARVMEGERLRYRSINSCIATGILLDGCHIITVEGLRESGELCEVQASMVRNFGSQCGFCTPGFVMSLMNMFEHKSQMTEQNVKNYLTGNLCRCTGYAPILKAALDVDVHRHRRLAERFPMEELTRELREEIRRPVLVEWAGREFYAPVSLEQAAEYKARHSCVRIFSGATDLGVQVNKGKDHGERLMSLHLIEELYGTRAENSRMRIGARVTLDRLQSEMQERVPVFANFLNIFASPQIKSAATLVGNLANGSPIADTIPFLLTMDAEMEMASKRGVRVVEVSRFFKGYKDLDLAGDEFISFISFALPSIETSKMALYKVSQRRDLDISCVNSGFYIQLEPGERRIGKARVAFGGVGPTPIRVPRAEDWLQGKTPDAATLGKARELIGESIAPVSDVRGSEEFRRLMCQRLFDRFTAEHLTA